jgi:caffeoyl-CoA O-methyltransferase
MKAVNLTPTLYQYCLENSLCEPEILHQLRLVTEKMPEGQMQISPDQGQFMRFLIKVMNAKTVLEIGTYTGYSALSFALALPDDGKVVTCDRNLEWTKVAKNYWKLAGVENKIELKLGQAIETLGHLKEQGCFFDFIFIDADKRSYELYYEAALSMLNDGGIIALDNVLQEGHVADPSNVDPTVVFIRELNQKIYQDKRVELTLLTISDGLTLVRKISRPL